ncbi:MAG: cupin domain-containing protein [Hyphomonadaceae bacterium]
MTIRLGYLIAPTRAEDFFARVFEREALVLAHNDPKRFEGLLSIDDIDRIVTETDLREGQLDLADASHRLARTDYVDAAGYIDRGAVADFHRGGATIILQQAHQLDPALGRFTRALEYVFSCHVQTNIYLTPPEAQGFPIHYDNHDVFVLQVAGEKAWRLYDKPVDTPYRGEGFQRDVHKAGDKAQDFVMKAGDCAYVPRGLMHDASTSGSEASLHVTVGLITRTWADLLLEAVSEVALRAPELRRSLPPGYANPDFDREPARAQLKQMAELVAREIALDPALELSIDDFIRSRPAHNRGAVREAGKAPGASERFQTTAHMPYRLVEDGDVLVLIAPGGELKFAPAMRAQLERALNGAPFTLADLGEGGEGLTAKLVAFGCLVRL